MAGLAGNKVPLGEGLGEGCQPAVGIFAPRGYIICVSETEWEEGSDLSAKISFPK